MTLGSSGEYGGSPVGSGLASGQVPEPGVTVERERDHGDPDLDVYRSEIEQSYARRAREEEEQLRATWDPEYRRRIEALELERYEADRHFIENERGWLERDRSEKERLVAAAEREMFERQKADDDRQAADFEEADRSRQSAEHERLREEILRLDVERSQADAERARAAWERSDTERQAAFSERTQPERRDAESRSPSSERYAAEIQSASEERLRLDRQRLDQEQSDAERARLAWERSQTEKHPDTSDPRGDSVRSLVSEFFDRPAPARAARAPDPAAEKTDLDAHHASLAAASDAPDQRLAITDNIRASFSAKDPCASFMTQARRVILDTPDHPLLFLLGPKRDRSGNFRRGKFIVDSSQQADLDWRKAKYIPKKQRNDPNAKPIWTRLQHLIAASGLPT